MKLVRFQVRDRTACGILDGDNISELADDFFGPLNPRTTVLARSSVKLLSPCSPSKIIAVGLNYRDHARELEMPEPDTPIIFLSRPRASSDPTTPSSIPKRARG